MTKPARHAAGKVVPSLKSVDLFAGCGGLSLGLEHAGFETVYVNELDTGALDTYVRNRSKSLVQDVRNRSQDILGLTKRPAELRSLADRLHNEHGDIDLVAGGPPCQGFSGIGHRRSFEVWREDIPSNFLYREMAKFIAAVAPRAFLFENVRGLMNARWTPAGDKGEIWEDVQKTFRRIHARRGNQTYEYEVRTRLVFARDHGVPQRRPRVVLVGIRSDVDASGDWPLPRPTGIAPDLIDLLDDLVDLTWTPPGGATSRYRRDAKTPIQRELRTRLNGEMLRRGDMLSEQEYSNHSDQVTEKFKYMLANKGEIPLSMRTKKFAQRVLPSRWGQGGPTITATSLPDDFVHYSQPRTPTVREWARLQTFPDWYEFSGRRTTGGRRRAGDPSAGDWTRDLPKYTQIGNAVPVRLAQALGDELSTLLNN